MARRRSIRRRVDLHAEHGGAGHRRGQRLCAAHAAEARRQDRPPPQIGRAEVHLAGGREGLVRPLKDPLGADVDPAPGGHLAEHRQVERLEPPELVPGRPAGHEQRVGDQHARRGGVRPEDTHRLAALDEQRLVLAQLEEAADEPAQRVVVAGGLARAAVDDQLLGMLGDFRIEVVQEHPQRRLGLPRPGVQLASARRSDGGEIAAELLDARVGDGGAAHASAPTSRSTAATKSPVLMAIATASMSSASGRSSITVADSERRNSCAARTPSPGSSGARNSTA